MLQQRGHDATHTIDLPAQNATQDRVINQVSLTDQRVVISKDTDFFYSHVLQGRPWKLLLVRTGNISTRDLRALFERNLPAIEAAFNPRRHKWEKHFRWEGPHLAGQTPIGRATVATLRINDYLRVLVRKELIEENVFPARKA